MPNHPDWREIAVNLVSALELQREAVAISHVSRSQSLTSEESRRLAELTVQIAAWEHEALESLESTHRDSHWHFQVLN